MFDQTEQLACPACRGGLTPVGDSNLTCRHCGRTYPVRNNIPVLLVDEAEPGPQPAGPAR